MQSSAQDSQKLSLTFTADALDYFILVFKTTLLTLITFGIYYPWARCQRLNYTLRNTRVGDQNLAFHGTGREMAIGYLKGLLVYGTIYGVFLWSQSVVNTMPKLALAGSLFFLVGFYGVFPVAMWGARAYRTSRLSYRGIRFGMDKAERKDFIKKTLLDVVFLFLSIGLYTPFFTYNLTKRLTSATVWGNDHFQFTGNKQRSIEISLTNLLISIFSLYLALPVTIIRRVNYNLANTSYQGMKIHSDLRWYHGYTLFIFPLIISTISLGLLQPWAKVWATRSLYSKIRFEGTMTLDTIQQIEVKGDALGETGASLLDLDMDMGFGV